MLLTVVLVELYARSEDSSTFRTVLTGGFPPLVILFFGMAAGLYRYVTLDGTGVDLGLVLWISMSCGTFIIPLVFSAVYLGARTDLYSKFFSEW